MRRLLFFHASWCSPCRFYEKQFIEPLEDEVGKDAIIHIDVQSDPFTAEKYLVDKLPTVILLDGKSVVERASGAIDINKMREWLKGGDAD